MSKRIGIIADGLGDVKAFEARLDEKYQIIKAEGPRGHTVAPSQIIRSAGKQVRILRALGCKGVILVTDLEKRNIRWAEFLAHLRREVKSASLALPTVVSASNRMIENWFLADAEHIAATKAFIVDTLSQKYYDGENGKRVIKDNMVAGTSYSETKHGPQLFSVIRVNVAKSNSKSFKQFADLVDEVAKRVAGKR